MVFTKFHAASFLQILPLIMDIKNTFEAGHGNLSLFSGENQEKVLEKNTNGIWPLGDPLQWGW